MYKYKIILKYLFRKIAPLFAAASVMLCVAMMIVVMSIMGGILNTHIASFEKADGDVTISAGSVTGFSSYEKIIKRLEARDEILRATPVISTLGLCSFKGAYTTSTSPVQIKGILAEEYAEVTNYQQALHWPPRDPKQLKTWLDDFTPSVRDYVNRHFEKHYAMHLDKPFSRGGKGTRDKPTVVLGMHVSNYHFKDKNGFYTFRRSATASNISLTAITFDRQGVPIGSQAKQFTVVNEIKTGSYEADKTFVYVDFYTLQKMLMMDAYVASDVSESDRALINSFEDETPGETQADVLGRVHEIIVKAKAGVALNDVKAIVNQTLNQLEKESPVAGSFPRDLIVRTWKEKNNQFLGAVEKEVKMISFLIGFMSIVSVFMVALTFYMIVLNKTKDMGILRAIGASQFGIIHIFLIYGLAIGVLGSLAGFALGYSIVTRINDVQYWLAHWLGSTAAYAGAGAGAFAIAFIGMLIMGRLKGRYLKWLMLFFGVLLPVALIGCYLILGMNDEAYAQGLNEKIKFVMWDPRVYVFDTIPNQVDQEQAFYVVIGGIFSGLLGAIIPAIIASLKDPVEALRYE